VWGWGVGREGGARGGGTTEANGVLLQLRIGLCDKKMDRPMPKCRDECQGFVTSKDFQVLKPNYGHHFHVRGCRAPMLALCSESMNSPPSNANKWPCRCLDEASVAVSNGVVFTK
jgi:hypothetical protein